MITTNDYLQYLNFKVSTPNNFMESLYKRFETDFKIKFKVELKSVKSELTSVKASCEINKIVGTEKGLFCAKVSAEDFMKMDEGFIPPRVKTKAEFLYAISMCNSIAVIAITEWGIDEDNVKLYNKKLVPIKFDKNANATVLRTLAEIQNKNEIQTDYKMECRKLERMVKGHDERFSKMIEKEIAYKREIKELKESYQILVEESKLINPDERTVICAAIDPNERINNYKTSTGRTPRQWSDKSFAEKLSYLKKNDKALYDEYSKI